MIPNNKRGILAFKIHQIHWNYASKQKSLWVGSSKSTIEQKRQYSEQKNETWGKGIAEIPNKSADQMAALQTLIKPQME